MDTRLTEEQRLIRDTAERLARELGAESPAVLPAQDSTDAGWSALAETGLLGMRLPEAAGGSALASASIALVAEQLGRFCVPLPFIGSAVCASELLQLAGASAEVLSALASGTLRLAPVLDPSLRSWAAPGEPGVAFESRGAHAGLVVDSRTGRLRTVMLGPALASQDLTRELRSVAANAPAQDVGDLGGSLTAEALERALASVLAAISADLVGVMQAALDLAVGYGSQREQFDVKIGSFQALQHMAAEALVSTEAARGCAYHAAWAVDALPPSKALEAACTAKAYASEYARAVCETSVQMHGGIGMTWEAMPHVHLRRALLGRRVWGDEHVHYLRLAAMRREASQEAR